MAVAVQEGVLVAGRALVPGDTVLQLPLIVRGPGQGGPPLCLGCLKSSKTCTLSPCPKCGWPICSVDCDKISDHCQECNLLQTSNTKCQIRNFSEPTNALDFILPLRVLQKLSSNKDLFKEAKINFQDFRRDSKSKNDENIIKVIKGLLKTEADEAKIRTALYIVAKYSLPLENGCQGLYEGVQQLGHSCCPNTYHTVTTNQDMLFRASVDIAKGAAVSHCRAELMKCNHFRRQQLEQAGILCRCPRCSDETEFGTGFGSPGGELLVTLDTQLRSLVDTADTDRESVLQFERLLERAGQWSQVAETSQLISDIKYRLIYIFQYHRDFYHPEEDYLQRKLKYCSDWLELSEKLYKGRNYQRLLIQYEWMNAAVSLMHWMKQNCKPTDEVNSFINKIVQMANGPIEILVDEEDGSFLKAFRDLVVIATEAREEQKRRVLISFWQDDEEEEW